MADPPDEPSLAQLLGGRRGALDASVPALAFAAGWVAAGRWDARDGGRPGPEAWATVHWASIAAGIAAVLLAAWRLYRGHRPRAVLIGLLGVAVAVLVVLRTGRAADFFVVQIVTNAASALVWLVSIAVRWPLLGLVVGTLLGQRTRWRRDPDLLRGYSRASWAWVAQYLVRSAILLPLWAADQVVALSIARAALTWPLVAACVAISWPLLRSALPAGHPGIRNPRDG